MRTQKPSQRSAPRNKKLGWGEQPSPMINASNIHFQMTEGGRALDYGGIGAIQLMGQRLGLAKLLHLFIIALLTSAPCVGAQSIPWPSPLPVYDHIVIVVEENKDFEQILGDRSIAPYINQLAVEGASIGHMFGEEHFSQGNYFWLFSGSNQNVGFVDQTPSVPLETGNLGEQLIKKDLSFKGYAESLPAVGSKVDTDPPKCVGFSCVYARKHVPWISFANVPNGTTIDSSSNLRFIDFPRDYTKLPTVAFVIPNLNHDMHNGKLVESIQVGDAWLRQNLDSYYQWAKTHNSLLIVTFDENDDKDGYRGLTNPMVSPSSSYPPSNKYDQLRLDLQNHIVTIFAGAHIKPDAYAEGEGITHVNILRTIEAMYGLEKSGAQQPNAVGAGISDDKIITDIFEQ